MFQNCRIVKKIYSFQVVMFQTYTNQNSSPIEAKYVFPLDDKAAVCGFEAFVNGTHIIGQVKCYCTLSLMQLLQFQDLKALV